MVEVPVFLINGFLESGKTTLIKDIINQDSKLQKLDTLLVVCETGEVEYDESFIKENHIDIVYIEDESELTVGFFNKLDKDFEPARVVIEYNSFYNPETIKDALPKIYVLSQTITMIDASSFGLYFNNMRQIFNNACKDADLIIFNRIEGIDTLAQFRRQIRAFNQNAQIAFEAKDGSMTDMLDEDLPYDINSDVINLEETDYPIWYMDCFDNYQKYYNKDITFIAKIEVLEDSKEGHIMPGRMVMTCCEADTQFLGFECINETDVKITDTTWALITVTIHHEYSSLADAEVVMLHAKKIIKLAPQEDKILSL